MLRLMHVFNKILLFKPHYIVKYLVGFFFLFSFNSSQFTRKKIGYNKANTFLEKGDYASIFQEYSGPEIWSITVFDNKAQQLSLVTSKWDTLLDLPEGTPITYSFWKDFENCSQQITNMGKYDVSRVLVACFSPGVKADTLINVGGSISLKQYKSVEYYSEGMTTVRLSSYNNNSILVYCAFGNDSIVPIALNTSTDAMPNFYYQIKGLKAIEGNSYEFRARWYGENLFFVALPYVKDSLQIDFFPG